MSPLAVLAIIAGSTLALAAIFWLIGFTRLRRTRDWTRTRGMVVNHRGGLDGWAEGYPTFQWYDHFGRRHQRTSMVHASLGPRPGTPVDVLYDPRRPERGQMDTFVQSGRIFLVVGYVIAGITTFGAVFAGWILVSVRSMS